MYLVRKAVYNCLDDPTLEMITYLTSISFVSRMRTRHSITNRLLHAGIVTCGGITDDVLKLIEAVD